MIFIITPFFNRALIIEAKLKFAINHRFDPQEIIIFDDGFLDNCWGVISNLVKNRMCLLIKMKKILKEEHLENLSN